MNWFGPVVAGGFVLNGIKSKQERSSSPCPFLESLDSELGYSNDSVAEVQWLRESVLALSIAAVDAPDQI